MIMVCRVVAGLFAVAWIVALAILAIGTWGLFGTEPAPLSGIYLLPLGLPWNRMIDFFPEALWPWLGAGAPAINLAILWALCRFLSRRTGPTGA